MSAGSVMRFDQLFCDFAGDGGDDWGVSTEALCILAGWPKSRWREAKNLGDDIWSKATFAALVRDCRRRGKEHTAKFGEESFAGAIIYYARRDYGIRVDFSGGAE